MPRITHGSEMHRDAGGGLPFEEDPGDPGVGGRLQSGYSIVRSFAGDAYLVLNGNLAALSSGDDTLILSANQETPGGGNDTKIRMLGGHGLVIPILSADPAAGASENGQIYYNDSTDTVRAYLGGSWDDLASGGAGAPTGADYLVGTAQGGLSAEIVVGATPSGELGGTWASPTVDEQHAGSRHDLVFVATPADTAINSVTDVTIVSQAITGLVAGDQLIVDAVFVILNTSGSSRIYTVSLDFDGQFAAEIVTGASGLTIGANRGHPFHVRGVLDIRSTSLAYAVADLEAGSATGTDNGANVTAGTTTVMGKVWGSSAADLTGTVTVALLIRSADATATQTLRLHNFTVRRIRA